MSENIVFLDRETIPAHITIGRPKIAHHWSEYTSTTAELGKRMAVIAQGLGMRVLLAERKGQTKIRTGRTGFEQVVHSHPSYSVGQ